MPSTSRRDVTRLLAAWSQGDEAAAGELMPLVYQELRQIARGYFATERTDHTLQPTAVVHEAYLRLVDQKQVDWKDRTHFYAFAAKVIRHVLVDHARRYRYAKRGGGIPDVSLAEVGDLAVERPEELVSLDEALAALAEIDPFKASIVEYRFFGGLTARETAEIMGCSATTVNRQWWMAKAWLYREMSRHGCDGE